MTRSASGGNCTTRNRMATLRRMYRRAKVWLNYLLDRIADLCNMVLMDAYRFPWAPAQNRVHCVARHAGDIALLLKAFPRLSAYKLIGEDWTIIFVGAEVGLREIQHLFFEEGAEQHELGRTALWQLPAQTQQWFAEGADLVVCELSRIHPNAPKVRISFSVPTWIEQSLTLPEAREALLLGRRHRSVRHNLKRAEKAGFSCYFSRSEEDLHHWHYNMYVPYMKKRYGPRALIASYRAHRERWFARGGLIVVTQNNAPLGGLLCYTKGDTCFSLDFGVLDGDPGLVEQGLKTFADWFAINWAYQQGARVYDMGGTRPWRSDGVFFHKSRWRPKIARRRRIYEVWRFLAQDVSPSLRDYLNKLGFISEVNGKFYGVSIGGDTPLVEETDIHSELLLAQKQGLAGLAIISPNGRMVIHDSAS